MIDITTKRFKAGLIEFAREYKGIKRTDMMDTLDTSYQNIWGTEKGSKTVSDERLDRIIRNMKMTPWEFWSLVPAYMKLVEKQAMVESNRKDSVTNPKNN